MRIYGFNASSFKSTFCLRVASLRLASLSLVLFIGVCFSPYLNCETWIFKACNTQWTVGSLRGRCSSLFKSPPFEAGSWPSSLSGPSELLLSILCFCFESISSAVAADFRLDYVNSYWILCSNRLPAGLMPSPQLYPSASPSLLRFYPLHTAPVTSGFYSGCRI